MAIVKVQIPLATNGDNALCLVYAKGKKNMVQQHVPPHVLNAMRGDARAFFEAEFEGGRWTFMTKRLPEHFW